MKVDEQSLLNVLWRLRTSSIIPGRQWFCSHLPLPAAVDLNTTEITVSVSLFASTHRCVYLLQCVIHRLQMKAKSQ